MFPSAPDPQLNFGRETEEEEMEARLVLVLLLWGIHMGDDVLGEGWLGRKDYGENMRKVHEWIYFFGCVCLCGIHNGGYRTGVSSFPAFVFGKRNRMQDWM